MGQELEQVEVADETYPETIGFLHLLRALLQSTAHTQLTTAYIEWVALVLARADSRPYRIPQERLKIKSLCLAVFETVLTKYKLSEQDFVDRYVEVCVRNGDWWGQS